MEPQKKKLGDLPDINPKPIEGFVRSMSKKELRTKLGVSAPTLRKWLKEAGLSFETDKIRVFTGTQALEVLRKIGGLDNENL